MKLKILAGIVALLLPAFASAGADILQAKCASCHALTKPENPTLERLSTRNAPDLWYAGSKFNKAWVVEWLQHPSRIRPAGGYYTKHVKASDKEDVIDETGLVNHPDYSAADAIAAADALMALTGPSGLVEKGAFKQEKVSTTMAAMFFNKLRGCSACHLSKPDSGGRSGPELYTAGVRLQGDYIASYIQDPQKFDPHIWMPTLNLSEPDVQRLTGYIVQLSGESK